MHSENIGPETCPASPHRFNMGKFSNFQKLPKCDALRQYWARNLPKCDALRKYWARDMSRIGPWGGEASPSKREARVNIQGEHKRMFTFHMLITKKLKKLQERGFFYLKDPLKKFYFAHLLRPACITQRDVASLSKNVYK